LETKGAALFQPYSQKAVCVDIDALLCFKAVIQSNCWSS